MTKKVSEAEHTRLWRDCDNRHGQQVGRVSRTRVLKEGVTVSVSGWRPYDTTVRIRGANISLDLSRDARNVLFKVLSILDMAYEVWNTETDALPEIDDGAE